MNPLLSFKGVVLFQKLHTQGLEEHATDAATDTQTKIHIHRLTFLLPFICFSPPLSARCSALPPYSSPSLLHTK